MGSDKRDPSAVEDDEAAENGQAFDESSCDRIVQQRIHREVGTVHHDNLAVTSLADNSFSGFTVVFARLCVLHLAPSHDETLPHPTAAASNP